MEILLALLTSPTLCCLFSMHCYVIERFALTLNTYNTRIVEQQDTYSYTTT